MAIARTGFDAVCGPRDNPICALPYDSPQNMP